MPATLDQQTAATPVFPHHRPITELRRELKAKDALIKGLDNTAGVMRDALHRLQCQRETFVNLRAQILAEMTDRLADDEDTGNVKILGFVEEVDGELAGKTFKRIDTTDCPECGHPLSPCAPGQVQCLTEGCAGEGVTLPSPAGAPTGGEFLDRECSQVIGPASDVPPPFPNNDDEAEILATWQLAADAHHEQVMTAAPPITGMPDVHLPSVLTVAHARTFDSSTSQL